MRNFISNHGLIMVGILLSPPEATVKSIASSVGITEQAAHVIVRDLAREGFITNEKIGRRNNYRVNWEKAFNRPALGGLTIRDIVNSLAAVGGAMTAVKSRVLLHVVEHTNAAPDEIAKVQELTTGEVHSALRELEKEGMVLRQRRGRRTAYAGNPKAIGERTHQLSVTEQILLAVRAHPQLPDPMDVLIDVFRRTVVSNDDLDIDSDPQASAARRDLEQLPPAHQRRRS
jgi:predicted transcriptional regulator